MLPLVQREAKSLGIAFDLDTPGVLEALPVCLAAYRKAWQEVTARDTGEVVPTPERQPLEALPTAKAKSKAKTLRDVYAPPPEVLKGYRTLCGLDSGLRAGCDPAGGATHPAPLAPPWRPSMVTLGTPTGHG